MPLPETADELCAVARRVGATDSDVFLGRLTTETKIRELNKHRRLKDYRVVHFATHGALAGEVGGASEPGLILSPPKKRLVGDDGYLSASEVANLKLDADWIVLSACNTAAGEAKDAEALSGLARAFFYAGARSLLVSHWYVDSNATVGLVTGTFRYLKNGKSGRARALQKSMRDLCRSGLDNWHPSIWGPFIVVGEGS